MRATAPPYEGDRDPPGFVPRLTNPGVTLVIGGNFNPVGHAMFRLGTDVGWVHVHKPYAFPDVVPANRFGEYLETNNKNVLAHIDVRLPFGDAALRKLAELRAQKWPWLVVPHNCVNFCEQIVQAGGCDWSSCTNLPYLITFLAPWITEPPPRNFQASVVIEGPARLSRGQTGTYSARTVGLPEMGNFRWWPRVGDELDGLTTTQMSFGQITVRAEKDSGKAAVYCKYVADKCDWAGRLEIALS